MKKFLLFWVVWSTVLPFLAAQSDHSTQRRADRLYDRGHYDKAELEYRKSLEKQRDLQKQYNLGNSIYRQERFDEAAKQFGVVGDSTSNADLKADAYFNQGNAYFRQKQYDQALGAYKKSLKARPNDIAAKQNLMMALQRKKEEEQQQQNQPQDKQQNQPQDPQQNPNDDEHNQQPNQQQNQNQQPKDRREPQDPQQDMKRREAEQLLKIIENEESKVHQKLQKGKSGQNSKSSKDW
jgi:tetratricopeptide (TPR) repeat protein